MNGRGRPPGRTTPEERVRHKITGLEGDVLEHLREPPFADAELAGPWLNVLWDDGFKCTVPERSVIPVP